MYSDIIRCYWKRSCFKLHSTWLDVIGEDVQLLDIPVTDADRWAYDHQLRRAHMDLLVSTHDGVSGITNPGLQESRQARTRTKPNKQSESPLNYIILSTYSPGRTLLDVLSWTFICLSH